VLGYIGEGRSPMAAGTKARSSAINNVLVVLAVAIKLGIGNWEFFLRTKN
jgi:hypothetical protein